MSQLSIVNCNASGVIPEWTTESFEAFEEGTSNRSHSTTTDEETSNDSYVPGTFEGPEKTLEVIFKHGEGKTGGLRNMDRAQLDELCTQAKCTILSKASTAHLDAYVLSESSLFVYDYRLIMKTCGTTTLLRCLGTLFEYADRLGMQLSWVGYSRKNFLFPTQQLWPHVSFTEEVRYIEQHESLQQRLNGDGHVLGPLNGDHWFVYVAEAKRSFSVSQSPVTTPGAISACPSVLDLPARAGASSPALDTPTVANNGRNHRSHSLSSANTSGDEDEEIKHDDSHRTSSAGKKTTDADNCVIENAKEEQQRSQLTRALVSLSAQRHSTYRTFNMMMFDMAPEVAATFFQGTNGLTGKEMTVSAGIPALCPGYTIDEAAFQPCGYSMNAVSDGNYATIHITPEAACSYVSFETNEQLEDYAPLLRRVLATFRPQRFVLTMFGDDDAIDCLPRMPTTHRSYGDIAGCPQGACYVRTTSTCTTVESQRQKCAMACYAYQPPMVEPAM